MRQLKTPVGFVVEDRDNGFYLLGELGDLSRAMKFITRREGLGFTERLDPTDSGDNVWTVEIGYDRDKPSPGQGAEWGTGPTREIAWRYALGAHFGSTEDPEV